MKNKKLLLATLIAIPALGLFTSGTLDNGGHGSVLNNNGILAAVGSPGDPGTCSDVSCHGAGNGNSTTGGLPDNGGPGNITISANPAFLFGNQYVPGQLYHMSVTVSQPGAGLFGFSTAILDNSGNTDLHINNTAGTITVTDAIRTRTGQAYGTGRKYITHKTNAGLSANSSTFTFDWTAPASGIVNMYYAGIGADNNGIEDAGDNVYTGTTQLSQAVSGIGQNNPSLDLKVYPNPARDNFTVKFRVDGTSNVKVQLYGLNGQAVRTFLNEVLPAGEFSQTFDTDGISKGLYLLKITSATTNEYKRIIIN